MAEDQGDSMVNGTKVEQLTDGQADIALVDASTETPAGSSAGIRDDKAKNGDSHTSVLSIVTPSSNENPLTESCNANKLEETVGTGESEVKKLPVETTSSNEEKPIDSHERTETISTQKCENTVEEAVTSRKISVAKDDVTRQEVTGNEEKKNEESPIRPENETNVEVTISEEEERLNEILKSAPCDDALKPLEEGVLKKEEDRGREEKSASLEKNIENVDTRESEDRDEESKKVKVQVNESYTDMQSDIKNVVIKSKGSPDRRNLRKASLEQSKISDDEKMEQSEVGIVGPPTAVSELINEEELRPESTLPTESKLQDHVAEWVQNSSTAVDPTVAEDEGDEGRGDFEESTKKKKNDTTIATATRKSQRLVTNIIKKSIKCLNKMHAMDGAGGNGKRDDGTHGSPKVPQSQQNGAALPEEEAGVTASTTLKRIASVAIKKEPISEPEQEATDVVAELQRDVNPTRVLRSEGESRKRRSTDEGLSGNENSASKRACFEQREHFISSLVGSDKVSADELAARADQLRAEVQALDELARAKEMEWNEILSMRKLKEEAYLRIERRRQVVGYMEGNAQITKTLPPATLALGPEWDGNGSNTTTNTTSGTAANTLANKDKAGYASQECSQDGSHDGFVEESLPPTKKEKVARLQSHRQASPSPKQSENGRKQSIDSQNLENRQIGEGRQGPIVDVRSIIADYRLRHPETVPRRMRNSVNVGLGAGGAMVETTGHTVDSRPSSTDSCKSNPNAVDPNSSMSFKDVLVQFAKLSQQQGEPVKTPQNYPDVTLHPVAPSPSPQNTQSQTAGSLLHGILTKSQSPRPTTFSPTLARLLTAPERERSGPAATSTPQQTTATQHLLQAYQGSNPVSISDLLSSSKARTEITITPVVNAPTVQSHSNNLIHVDDVEEETTVIEERSSRVSSGSRDNRDDRDSPPRCQGCHERAAQFVCAGCGNQWYCSRECQVSAWDEHSEVCSG
ncbi:uncharacterized protein LOC107268797 isoform X2 [Cephus cinctus]|uniref:Uncharacterized protein LOC107268797 isoform X2 n=1 Tax=Cephus cinctus TaxID=211228 RepID=A0AAJ7RIV7_CEPCN|nr:uncharacterized protein LOC107268797 isoform X2 [Cephus cinctus]